MTDPAYAERMAWFINLLMAIEREFRGYAIGYLTPTLRKCDPDPCEEIIECVATMHVALRIHAEEEGIEFAELDACGLTRHPSIARLIQSVQGSENPEYFAAHFREYVAT